MRNLFVALAVSGLLLIPTQKAFGQTANQQTVQLRTQAVEESARASATMTSLVETYKQLLERETGITPDEKRQIANAIDQGNTAIPDLVKAVRDVYTRFRGDRVFAGVTLGIGGDFHFFQNRNFFMTGRVPYVRDWNTGADASVGVAAAIVRNDVDGSIFPDFSAYISVGLNESRATTPARPARAAKATTAASSATAKAAERLQLYVVWRIFLAPANELTSLGLMAASDNAGRTPSHVGALSGTYIGGGTQHKWRMTAQPVSLQTQVYGRWSLPEASEVRNMEVREVAEAIIPEIVMIQLAQASKLPGRAAPVFAAQGGVQYIAFFGTHQL